MTTAIQPSILCSEVHSPQDQPQDQPIGCWDRWKRRVTQIKSAGTGILSGVMHLASKPFAYSSEANGIKKALYNNWAALKKILHLPKSTLIRSGIEFTVFAACYAHGRGLDAPGYLFIFSLLQSSINSNFPPQNDPELVPWKKMLDSLQEQRPIKKPLYLAFSEDLGPCCNGSEKGPSRQIIIQVPKDEYTPEERSFILAHEYSHALNNDKYYQFITTFAVQTMGAGVFWLFSSSSQHLIVRSLKFALSLKSLGMFSDFLQRKYWEQRADDTALQFSPQKELSQGGALLFERFRREQQVHRSQPENTLVESLWKNLTITPSGNTLFDDHPFLTSRRDKALAILSETIAKDPTLPEK